MDEASRRFMSIIVVAMLLLVVLMMTLVLIFDPPGDGDGEDRDPGWKEKDGLISVYANATWSGWDRTLALPVRIDVGCTLTIEDSRLEIPLEAMVFDHRSPFEINWEGSLVLRNSTLVVDADPQLEGALVNPYSYDPANPVAWRVVNLRQAVDPVLEVDVMMARGLSYLVVAAQMAPDGPLEPLEVLEPEEMELYQWTTLRVSLEDYVGGTPRVAVLFQDSNSTDIMVSNIRVTDGGDPLPGDIFLTGDLAEDGWTLEHLSDFTDLLSHGEWIINPLIVGTGDLLVEDSRVLSLPGLYRRWSYYRPQAQGGATTLDRVPDAGCINVSGDITFLSSEVAYVPIKSMYGAASFEGCTLVGDREILALAGMDATVVDCDLAFQTREGLWSTGFDDVTTWLLSMESIGAQALVEGCTFTGEGIGTGVVLNGASVIMEDCSFSDLTIGVWDHESIVPLSWLGSDPSVSFSSSCRIFYMETAEVVLEFEGPERPTSIGHGYTYWSSIILDDVPGLEDVAMMEMMNDHYAHISLPVVVIGPAMGKVVVEGVELHVQPRWSDDGETITIDPRVRDHDVWIEDDEDPGNYYEHSVFQYWRLDVAEEAGVLREVLAMSMKDYFTEPYLNISLDGVQVDRVDLSGPEYNLSSYGPPVVIEQAIPTGAHNVTITVGAYYAPLNWTLELDRLTAWVYRASERGEAAEAAEWLVGRSLSALMIDPGTDLQGYDHVEEPVDVYQQFSILTWEGSHVEVDRLVFDPSTWEHLILAGNGTVVIGNADFHDTSLTIKNCTTIIQGLTSNDYLSASISGAEVHLVGGLHIDRAYIEVWNGTDLRVEGIEVNIEEDLDVIVLGGRASIGNCTFSTSTKGRVGMSSAYGASWTFDSCTFEGVPLDVRFYDHNDTAHVRDCVFEGGRALMTMLPSQWGDAVDPSLMVPRNGSVSGNAFTGEGAGLVVDPLVRERLLGTNQIVDGAKAYVLFDPEVVIQSGNADYIANITTLDSFIFQRTGYVPWDSDAAMRTGSTIWWM